MAADPDRIPGGRGVHDAMVTGWQVNPPHRNQVTASWLTARWPPTDENRRDPVTTLTCMVVSLDPSQDAPHESGCARIGVEEPQLAGTSDRRGAICDTELGVDAADMRADRVRRDGQLAGDLGPGQVRRQISQ